MLSTNVAKYWLAHLLSCPLPSGAVSPETNQYIYVGLSSTTPTAEGGNITEPMISTGVTDPNYHKVDISGRFAAADTKRKWTNQDIYFPKASASWTADMSHLCLYTSTSPQSTTGEPQGTLQFLWSGEIVNSSGTATPISVATDQVVLIEQDASASSSPWSNLVVSFDETPTR